MAENQVDDFWGLLKKSGLLTPQQFDAAQKLARSITETQNATGRAASGKSATGKDNIAAQLVKAGLLTSWQASQLLKGQTGFVLQKYQLLMPVGRGGMGHVFKARDTSTENIVAIKVMSRKLTGNQTLVNRFRREIRASSLLNSPHIVRTLDAGRVGKVDFMVMEFVNGDQVDHIAARVGQMPVSMACDIIRQAARGLQHAYEQKMVHRDLKPGNLIVDWSADGVGTVKIMDMGLVRLGTDGDERTSVTKAGQVMGTPDYMSPEQGWDTATVDIRSDIYSLGCTLFRLLTGRVPFPGDNPLQVLMARCSKDAPSVKSVRADIPDPVDAIVRRMTLRDPSGRYQTPQELVEVLEPFSSPLTTVGLRNALQDAGQEDVILLEMASSAESNDSQDAGYQQFLREMDSGAAVDLMMSTTGGQVQSTSATTPVLPQVDRFVSGDRRPSGSRRSPSRTTGTAGVIALASGSAVVALIALFVMLNRGGENSGTDQTGAAKPLPTASDSAELAVPEASLRTPQPVQIAAGGSLRFRPELEQTVAPLPEATSLRYQLGKGAPAGVEISQETGEVRWDIPREQSAARYDIPIELTAVSDKRISVIASTVLVAEVQPLPPQYVFEPAPPVILVPDELIELSIQTTPVPEPDTGLKYRLGTGKLPGMALDPISGQFRWTPGAEATGRNRVTVQLHDPTSGTVVAEGQLVIMVRPSMSLPKFEEQTAKAGDEFQLQLRDRPTRIPGRVVRVVVKEGAPPGVSVDMRRGVLSWRVPNDASGRYEIGLQLESLLPDLEFRPDEQRETTIVVNVAGTVSGPMIPPDAEVKAAESELRELYKRDLAGAKSVSERTALAMLLLERSEGQLASATDYALLLLVEELAEKARATDVGLRIGRIRAQRYGTSEIADAIEMAASFRSTGLSPLQTDSVIENFLRIALMAAKAKQFADVIKLLDPPEQLLRRQDRQALIRLIADDVSGSIRLAKELMENSAGATADLKATELERLLERWQFRNVLNDASTLNYLSSESDLEENGRSLWMIDKQRIRLNVTQQIPSVGILDPGMEAGRFILRLQLSNDTTKAAIILGAGREQNLNAHLLSIDKSNLGRIAMVPSGTEVAGKISDLRVSAAGWSDIEILVDSSLVAMRVNGQSVSTSQVPGLKQGRLGLLIPVDLATMTNLDIRDFRILILP